jgi:hypothetical protein
MKSKLLAIFLLAGSSLFAREPFSVGGGVGGGHRPFIGNYHSGPAYRPGYAARRFAGGPAPRWDRGRHLGDHGRR